MTLDKLNIGDIAVIKAVNCESELKNRFYSFGMVKGSKVTVEEITLARSTMEVKIKNTKVAIRFSEAAKIEIEDEQ
ncbi:FeoA family protein [Poseidonibacter ostreae]|jgi:ferrous iron transport protein A|uniref:Ferrous iron transport protein A n=1 Tax=Poseidonibacter ostreae TaxID=2654171 RepID=A0A6L4WV20_9BACT|nr:FeoA family protein [Poseidonibacter ostreae]KAB7885406.1 ferrous iron transport protein A [Poseidonibacter ostreae]KAB7890332.1 ferrous iron transport protein A [Poseidonibacter ostreae]KAB7890562.1 ferrous iron transport protein A [Poseidonibacter ostreae]MAC85164.1 iron transporter [Arcobacter sp.]|tara:strand:+ start:176 stop:403 length:228 start_codon:yes stop_codon:yes gene_type:complete